MSSAKERGGEFIPLPIRSEYAGRENVRVVLPDRDRSPCPFVYDGCTRIHFPIHTSKKFAHRVGLADIILEETATLAFAVREITRREAPAGPAGIRAISCRFNSMVFPGDKIDIQLLGERNTER